MTPKELTQKTITDITKRRLLGENEFYGYQRERTTRHMRSWNTKVGGSRW